MATSGMDRRLNIWDLRTYKRLQEYRMRQGAGHLAFSQSGLLAASQGNIVEVWLRLQNFCIYVWRNFMFDAFIKWKCNGFAVLFFNL